MQGELLMDMVGVAHGLKPLDAEKDFGISLSDCRGTLAQTESEKEGSGQGVKRKREDVDPLAAEEEMPMLLTVALASGKEVASILALPSWTGAGTLLQGLLADSQAISSMQTVAELGLSSGSVLQAVVGKNPALYLFNPCSAVELAERYGSFLHPKCKDVFDKSVMHRGMSEAPEAARDIATALAGAFGTVLQEFALDRDEDFDHGSEVIVISNASADTKQTCLDALGIPKEPSAEIADDFPEKINNFYDLALVSAEDWSQHLEHGLRTKEPPDDNEDEEEDDEDKDDQKVPSELIAGTRLMAERLRDHFTFRFKAAQTDFIHEEPVIFGGFADDGSIVGVLTGQHWD